MSGGVLRHSLLFSGGQASNLRLDHEQLETGGATARWDSGGRRIVVGVDRVADPAETGRDGLAQRVQETRSLRRRRLDTSELLLDRPAVVVLRSKESPRRDEGVRRHRLVVGRQPFARLRWTGEPLDKLATRRRARSRARSKWPMAVTAKPLRAGSNNALVARERARRLSGRHFGLAAAVQESGLHAKVDECSDYGWPQVAGPREFMHAHLPPRLQ